MKTIIKTIFLVTIGVAIGRIRHYQTKYKEDGILKVESWIQINILGQTYCVSKKLIELS